MKKLSKIFAVVLTLAMVLSMLPMGASAATTTEKSVKFTVDNLGLGAYADGTKTVDDVAVQFTELASYGDGIQMRNKNGKASALWNTAALPGGITKIVFTWSATKTNGYDNANALTITFGDEAKGADYTAKLNTVKGDTLATYTITPDAATYTYFNIDITITFALYWDSIEVFYNETTTGGETGGDNTDGPDNTGDNTAIVAMTTALVMSAAAMVVLVLGKKRMF